ncbi:hypothetical protein PILCRDRAFT_812067 [Piloderma croceum F 1598]|uniref:Uncharacterized protein n=1 Tax=Piloderma croceum (strain F 1598) TaxID=765440 RepID=A0A0C3CKY9_PILCF|nr:hypothetical protein PILCRDRAFT_812067 [Piloderma croceum F 1598]
MNYASWPPMRPHSKLPRWKLLLLQMLYIQETDHQMLDLQVDFGEAARLRGEGPEEERIPTGSGRGRLQELKDQHLRMTTMTMKAGTRGSNSSDREGEMASRCKFWRHLR